MCLNIELYNYGHSDLPKMIECKVNFGRNVGIPKNSEVFKQIIQ